MTEGPDGSGWWIDVLLDAPSNRSLIFFVVLVAAAGCLGDSAEAPPPIVETCETEPSTGCLILPANELLRMSDCFVMTHSVYASDAVFRPTYPPGTAAAQEGLSVAGLTTFFCKQATVTDETIEDFQVSYFASVIDGPGRSADGATEARALHDLITNSPAFAEVLQEAGLDVTLVKGFSFAQTAAPGDVASPYVLRVPAERTMYAFEGTSNAAEGGPIDHVSDFLYAQTTNDSIAILKVSFDRHLANPSQHASASFGPESYWARNSPLSTYPSVNYQGKNASGNFTLEFPGQL